MRKMKSLDWDAKGVYEVFSRINRPSHSHIDGKEVLFYTENALAKPNRDAIRGFLDYSIMVNAKLVFLLIPPKQDFTNRHYYTEVRRYLQGLGIPYLHLSEVFDPGDAAKYYWPVDEHLNETGNEFAGAKLYEFIARLD